ncbi:carbamoyl phosphate synthase small subunit [soil metagenome]
MPSLWGRTVTYTFELKRYLVLGDGSVFEGRPLGADGATVGEVVFNTGMTGYQEILTDPSYAGQIVLLTYPLIGNYGVNDDDFESDRVQPTGLIVKEAAERPSNWRATSSIDAFLKARGTVSIQGLDTRLITKRLRNAGVTMGAIAETPEAGFHALETTKDYGDTDFVEAVSRAIPDKWGVSGKEAIGEPDEPGRARLAVLDCGLKHNILRRFYAAGCRPVVFPHNTTADEIMAWKPDGILLSPGPGDPARLAPIVETVKNLIGKRPMFGICLGNQLLCQAVGGTTFKLKYGHRGSNHPVKDLRTGKVTITSQNHGYAVDLGSLSENVVAITQINLNDGTPEGIQIKGQDAESIQYHPEAAPGPWDSRPYFAEFVAKMRL